MDTSLITGDKKGLDNTYCRAQKVVPSIMILVEAQQVVPNILVLVDA